MPRSPMPRQIREDLEGRLFKPQGVPMSRLETLPLTLDGLEALRLADLDGLYQEEAAGRMEVSRATFARVLAEARRIVAEALVHGKALEIGGGTVETRRERNWPCPVHGGPRRRGRGCRCGGRGGGGNRPSTGENRKRE